MSLLWQQEESREALLQQIQQRRETCGGKLLEVGGQKVLIDVNFHSVAVSLLFSNNNRRNMSLQYLEKRFSKMVRTAASMTFVVQMTMYMAIVLYAPSLALNAVRHTVWSLTIGGYFTWVAIYGVNQAQVQRACTCPTLRRGQIALLLNAPGLCCILYLGCLIGVVVYAFYSECDPIGAKLIDSKDQILPLFVMDVLGDVIGLPGLFVACLFSGALSTISSGLNSIAAAVLEDVVRLYWAKDISDLWATRLTQIIALIFGVLCLALTYVASQLGNVLQAALSLFGMIAGPLLGVFTLGMMCPWANQWGAISGLFFSLVFMFWIGVGAFIEKPPIKPPPAFLNLSGCGNFSFNVISNITTTHMTTIATTLSTNSSTTPTEKSPEYYLYTLSYIWYGMYSVLAVVIVGLIISFLTGYTRPSTVDPKLIIPIFDIIPPFRFLPESIRKPLRFGIVHKGKYDNMPTEEDTLKVMEELASKSLGDVLDKTIVVSANGTKSKESNGVVNPAHTYSDENELRERNGKTPARGVNGADGTAGPTRGYINRGMEGESDEEGYHPPTDYQVTRI
ncbi:hypothetical protein C0Q70_02211 [Pomacea canaliculata]|uniref:Sodium-coupled monocarboxylate transporter 2 n=1 Tax=Pomacea canaliculata TaxID=400727 RepID=A0A2T7Q1P7_POMCA|nr:hypothetical protein C0Q70_02211 [Pomacea canaliculata]